MTATRCLCILTGLTVTVPDPDCRVQAHSPQWQDYEADIRAGNQAAMQAIKTWQARGSAERDILAGSDVPNTPRGAEDGEP